MLQSYVFRLTTAKDELLQHDANIILTFILQFTFKTKFVYCFQKEKHKKPTYRREVMSATWLSSIFAGQEHVIQLVAQSVHKLQVGPFKVSGWEKEPEV